MRDHAGTFFFVSFPLETGGQEQPRWSASVQKRCRVEQRIGREVQDLLFVFLNPGETILKGHLLLPITIGKVDRQPVRSAFAKRLAVGKLDAAPVRCGRTVDSSVAARGRRVRDDPPARENRISLPRIAAPTDQSGTPSFSAGPSVGPHSSVRKKAAPQSTHPAGTGR